MVANAFQAQIAIPSDRPQAFQRTVPTAARIKSTATVSCTRDATALSLQKLSGVKTPWRITKSTRVPTNSNMVVTNQFEYLSTGLTAPLACLRVAENYVWTAAFPRSGMRAYRASRLGKFHLSDFAIYRDLANDHALASGSQPRPAYHHRLLA
jgi:hypothetical protein